MRSNIANAEEARLFYGEPDPAFYEHHDSHDWVKGSNNAGYVDGVEIEGYCRRCEARCRWRYQRNGEAGEGNAAACQPCPRDRTLHPGGGFV